MVVIFLPDACDTGVWQERTASPLRWTVQAPHRPAPQPNFVPVICKCSRTTHKSGVSFGTSTEWSCPLMFRVTMLPRLAVFYASRTAATAPRRCRLFRLPLVRTAMCGHTSQQRYETQVCG